MNRTGQFGVSAWSWINTLGTDSYEFEELGGHPSGTLRSALQNDGLSSHKERLGIDGYSGQSAREPRPLPSNLSVHESRCARLLTECLTPIGSSIRSAIKRYGSERVAIVIGSSTSGIDATERALQHSRAVGHLPESYQFGETHAYDALLRLTAKIYGVMGPAYVVSTACSSAGKAIGTATRLLSSGQVDAVLTGGGDGLCELTVRGFAGLGVLSNEKCRPFDKTRAGINIGEGAALLLLERETASPYSVLGVGESGDAHHATAPHPEGLGAKLAIERCLAISGLSPTDVDYLNAHGTGTEKNDSMESLAIREVLGDVPFSSTKHGTGHQLGAAGATEAVICLQALGEGFFPKNRTPEVRDDDLAAQPIFEMKEAPSAKVALSNSFAFGGSNVSVALGRGLPRWTTTERPATEFYVYGAALWTPAMSTLHAWLTRSSGERVEKPPAALLPARSRGRASVLTRMYAELFSALEGSPEAVHFDRSQIPLVFSSAYGEMTTTLKLLDQMAEEPTLSPIRFQASVHNTAGGQLSLATKNRNFSTSIASGTTSFTMGLLETQAYLASHGGEALLLVGDEAAAERLMPQPHFNHLGVGLHLSLHRLEKQVPLAKIGWVCPSNSDQELAADCPPELVGAPPAWGLALLDALFSDQTSEQVAVGPQSTLFLQRA